MGFDGGTIPSRSDLLRRASWRLTCQDNTRSTRGGQIFHSNYKFVMVVVGMVVMFVMVVMVVVVVVVVVVVWLWLWLCCDYEGSV